MFGQVSLPGSPTSGRRRPVVLVTPHTFGRGDATLRKRLEATAGEVRYVPSAPGLGPDELIPLVSDIDGWIAGLDQISRAVIEKAPRLRVIARYGVGTDQIDLDAARERQIVVTNTPNANADAVAELVIGFLFVLARSISWSDREIRSGRWPEVGGYELGSCRLGLVGLGAIGRSVARRARALGCHVLASDPIVGEGGLASCEGADLVDLDTLLASADVVSLHVPLNDSTRGMVDTSFLARMRPGARLVNTARGELVDESALIDALHSGRLAGAALDVHAQEPLTPAHPLFAFDNVVLTPHIGAGTVQAAAAMGRMSVDNCLAVLAGGRPAHPVVEFRAASLRANDPPCEPEAAHAQILRGVRAAALAGRAGEVRDLVCGALDAGLPADQVLRKALIPALEEIGTRFQQRDLFVPEMFMAASALQGALDVMRPQLSCGGDASGLDAYDADLPDDPEQDFVRSLTRLLLAGAALTLTDLGVDFAPEALRSGAAAARESIDRV